MTFTLGGRLPRALPQPNRFLRGATRVFGSCRAGEKQSVAEQYTNTLLNFK